MGRELKEFLSPHMSRGPFERPSPQSEFTTYDSADFDVKFLLSLIKRKHPLTKVACIPTFKLCVLPSNRAHYGQCDLENKMHVRSGIVLLDVSSRPRLLVPPQFEKRLEECRPKRFALCNFGLYSGSDLSRGHANALVFDLWTHTIERFEPIGQYKGHAHVDAKLRGEFSRVLPGWKYVGTSLSSPKKGPQAIVDAFDGLCVTFSLMYVLMRLKNPDLSAFEVNRLLLYKKTPSALRREVLQLNRHVIDRLKMQPRGSLRNRLFHKASARARSRQSKALRF